jgi:hypothetical protein
VPDYGFIDSLERTYRPLEASCVAIGVARDAFLRASRDDPVIRPAGAMNRLRALQIFVAETESRNLWAAVFDRRLRLLQA